MIHSSVDTMEYLFETHKAGEEEFICTYDITILKDHGVKAKFRGSPVNGRSYHLWAELIGMIVFRY